MSEQTPRERMADALEEVRREGRKVALIYAAVDAALVTMLVNVALNLFLPSSLPESVALPAAAAEALGRPGFRPEVATAILAGMAAGLAAFVAEFLLRIRRPAVEQFENANPEVREALRTARDAVGRNRDSEMAARLYEDVIESLRATSSAGLVSLKRVTLTVVVVLALSVASILVAVVDVNLFGGDDGPNAGNARPDEYTGLKDGDQILGQAENVSAGDNELEASLDSQRSGDSNESESAPASYDTGGFAGSGDVESQQAGFAADERLADADLIREYNLKIREGSSDSDQNDDQ